MKQSASAKALLAACFLCSCKSRQMPVAQTTINHQPFQIQWLTKQGSQKKSMVSYGDTIVTTKDSFFIRKAVQPL